MATNTLQGPARRFRGTLPTERELELALSRLDRAPDAALDVSARVTRVAKFEGKRAPTFEEIGRLLSWAERAREPVEEALGYVADVEGALRDLDYVRLFDNVNPDDDGADGRESTLDDLTTARLERTSDRLERVEARLAEMREQLAQAHSEVFGEPRPELRVVPVSSEREFGGGDDG